MCSVYLDPLLRKRKAAWQAGLQLETHQLSHRQAQMLHLIAAEVVGGGVSKSLPFLRHATFYPPPLCSRSGVGLPPTVARCRGELCYPTGLKAHVFLCTGSTNCKYNTQLSAGRGDGLVCRRRDLHTGASVRVGTVRRDAGENLPVGAGSPPNRADWRTNICM